MLRSGRLYFGCPLMADFRQRAFEVAPGATPIRNALEAPTRGTVKAAIWGKLQETILSALVATTQGTLEGPIRDALEELIRGALAEQLRGTLRTLNRDAVEEVTRSAL